MNKLSFIILLLFTCLTIKSQEIPSSTIGIRLSEGVIGGEGFGPEITYQKQLLGAHNRIDLTLSWKTNSLINTYRLGGYFHWNYPIWKQLNWFAGPGIGAGYIDFKDSFLGISFSDDRASEIFPFLSADFGVDYRFDFPLQVAFSIRPTYDIHTIKNTSGINDIDNFGINIGVAARYVF